MRTFVFTIILLAIIIGCFILFPFYSALVLRALIGIGIVLTPDERHKETDNSPYPGYVLLEGMRGKH